MSKDHENIEALKKKNALTALKEAEERKKDQKNKIVQKEINGREGPEPTRYNDWEKNGIVSDF
jgi:hypothetical protein